MRFTPFRTLRRVLFLAVVLACVGTPAQVSSAERPNVLFLICDDLNCDIGCYGHPQVQTPHIDALANRGVRFANAYCQYPLCGPSRASMMTGWYPDQTLIHRNAIHLRERAPQALTVAQHFRDAGYLATRIGKIFHYNVPLHIGTGGHDDPYSWDQTINPRGRDVIDQDQVFSLRPGQYGGTLSWFAAEGDDQEQTDGIAADHAIERLEHHAGTGEPFFLAVGLYRPHTPYVAPTKYFDLYPIDEINVPTVPDGYLETLPKPAAQSITRKKEQVNLDPALAKQAIQAYRASITFADAQLGRILDALQRLNLSDNTIVLFTSDHGYHMGEHGHYQKTTLFENATHVPLILAGPGLHRGGVAATMAEMTDFYPTLAELAGLPIPPMLSGTSLVPALQDPTQVVRESALTQFDGGYSLRTARYRYTEWGPDGAAGAELYDRRADPEELHNRADDEDLRQVRTQLSGQLRERIDQANRVPEGFKRTETTVPRMVKSKR
ncbi:sulfatase [Roseiconus nitratireducens]|uniref:Sulfatase n=1 Tax=Roseiconus nitratireducens TaxID=2605748 RepID=A0A5M6D6V3_9BACT|nr:sulfatase [Roseiconus nitratireducens]KAA5543258.1 sulfatase [Roseiconus nitratireducens]